MDPKNSIGTCLLLAKGANEEQKDRMRNQAGDRVFLFLYTDDFWRDYKKMQPDGIVFVREPIKEIYGTVTVFKDLYGNLWDLLEPNKYDFFLNKNELLIRKNLNTIAMLSSC